MMKIRNILKNDAVTEVVGTILLLGIAMSLFSVVSVFVLSYQTSPAAPSVNIVGAIEGTNIILDHRGGEPLELETKIIIEIDDQTQFFRVEDFLSTEFKKDGKWNIGERILYPFNCDINNQVAKVRISDIDSNSLVMMGTIKLDLVSDLSVTMSVSNNNPYINEIITFTITVTNNRGNINATDTRIEFLLPPASLEYQSNTTTDGFYNYNTGVWNIDKISVGQSKVLTVDAKVIGAGSTDCFTQMMMILDGSGSINGNDWTLCKNGLASAIQNPSYFPHDGSVELTVLQFGRSNNNQPNAQIEIGPIVIDDTNFATVASDINAISQMGGYTPMACGIALGADTLASSPNFATSRHVINLVTDGKPNAIYNLSHGDYKMESWGSTAQHYINGKASADEAREYLVNILDNSEDELDAEGVGNGPEIDWLKENIVWPGNYTWDGDQPEGPGWVRHVASYEEFANTIHEKFELLFNSIFTTVKVLDTLYIDPNQDNNAISIIITPQ